MKKIAVDYKGKYFIIQDEDTLDDMDFVVPYMDVEYVLTKGLKTHVAECIYYGIPAYIGSDKELKEKIEKLEKEYLEEEKQ